MIGFVGMIGMKTKRQRLWLCFQVLLLLLCSKFMLALFLRPGIHVLGQQNVKRQLNYHFISISETQSTLFVVLPLNFGTMIQR